MVNFSVLQEQKSQSETFQELKSPAEADISSSSNTITTVVSPVSISTSSANSSSALATTSSSASISLPKYPNSTVTLLKKGRGELLVLIYIVVLEYGDGAAKKILFT